MLTLDNYEKSLFFTEKERAALAWATEITANNRYSRQEIKDRLKVHFTDPEIVDLTLACCWYSFMNRFNDGLEVDIDTEAPEELLALMHATPAPHEIALALNRVQPSGND
jgi:alkylhydroperoxidase family enzyme